mmetsp:Transcript_2128/g.3349  ORF Transcript_2128/g.3349 Transcript_2128/m.3349 type:complete len:404 (-) Transcript_2128:158-1369(-)|eukprot:CAMPEP_0174970128 /NCGR_PEP_ID=MMETSP0004_2-20121128/9187_1 /TAXON_ID=420556 /ORGANISM="Ochromonas sp., Strain CCMP1393" /LENGTH=403 /DNA_ID=CAMNT_0016219777 /DNA_START=119 /DNA_END=1330 /DNA_ORIENTATION=+
MRSTALAATAAILLLQRSVSSYRLSTPAATSIIKRVHHSSNGIGRFDDMRFSLKPVRLLDNSKKELATPDVTENRQHKTENTALWGLEQAYLSPTAWKGLMLLICIIWATNFAIIKEIFAVLPDGVLDPSLYVAIRFTLAAIVMAPGAAGSFNNWGLIRNGIGVGLCVFLGYIGQSLGILESTANKTAFFCSLNVVWVALVNGVRTGEFAKRTWAAIALAVTGAAFIELKGFVEPNLNDLWLILQPIGFGSGYLVLEENMKQYPESSKSITSWKLFTIGICTTTWAAMNGHTLDDLAPILESPIATAGILYTSLITTAFAILLQSIVFKKVSSTDASIILTSEPIWAAAFAVALIGEVITWQDYVGGAFIILGCLLNEIDIVAKFKEFSSGGSNSEGTKEEVV